MMVCSTHTVKISNLLTTLIVIRDVTWIYIYIYIYIYKAQLGSHSLYETQYLPSRQRNKSNCDTINL